MDEIAAVKLQAVEFARAVLEARDAELAFILQVQETVRISMADIAEPLSPDDDDAALEEQSMGGTDFEDDDRHAALRLTIHELGNLTEETEEMQLSIIEASRLAHLDAIQEHDAHFARTLADMPRGIWDKTGGDRNDPFTRVPDPLPTVDNVEDFEMVRQLIQDPASVLPTLVGKSGSDDAENNEGLVTGTKVSNFLLKRQALLNLPFHDDAENNEGLVTGTKVSNFIQAHLNLEMKKNGKGLMQDDDIRPSPFHATQSSYLSTSHRNLDEYLYETDLLDGARQEVCQICFEATPTTSFFKVEGCGHRFCKLCNSRHAEARVLSAGQMDVTCPHPGCPTILSLGQISLLLSAKTLDILTGRQIEAAIPDSERVYCPYLDCSALLMKPIGNNHTSSSTHPHATAFGCVECEFCHRSFCLECAVPWHGDLSCAAYQGEVANKRLAGDEKLLQLADQKKWQRCKNCRRIVELSTGCHHMTCLCGHGFCYLCGADWVGSMKACSCTYWNEARL